MRKKNLTLMISLCLLGILTGCKTKETAQSDLNTTEPAIETVSQPESETTAEQTEETAADEEQNTPSPGEEANTANSTQQPEINETTPPKKASSPVQPETTEKAQESRPVVVLPSETQKQQNTNGSYLLDDARKSFALQNERRAAQGVSALVWNESLYQSASVRAAEIVQQFSHTRPDGTSCFTAVTGKWKNLGENIAYGQTTAQQVTQSWYDSEGHRNNMLRGNFTSAAVACYEYQGRKYWVTLFGE